MLGRWWGVAVSIMARWTRDDGERDDGEKLRQRLGRKDHVREVGCDDTKNVFQCQFWYWICTLYLIGRTNGHSSTPSSSRSAPSQITMHSHASCTSNTQFFIQDFQSDSSMARAKIWRHVLQRLSRYRRPMHKLRKNSWRRRTLRGIQNAHSQKEP